MPTTSRRELLKSGCAIIALGLPKSANGAFWQGQTYRAASSDSSLFDQNLFSPAFGASAALRTTDRPAVSTADYYNVNGGLTYAGRAYDLDDMGAWGAARKAAKGYRYFWFIAPNHNSFIFSWGLDTETIYIGYSSDPAIPPDPSTLIPIITSQGVQQPGTAASFNGQVAANGLTLTVNSISSGIVALGYTVAGLPVAATISAMVTGKGGTGTYTLSANQGGTVSAGALTCTFGGVFIGLFYPWFVYNPDDVGSPGYLYMQCIVSGGSSNTNAWNNGLWSTSDLDTFTFQGIAFTNTTGAGFGFTAVQTVERLGVNNWLSRGSADTGSNGGVQGYWTSSDGRRFEYQASTTNRIGQSTYGMLLTPRFTVSAQDYVLTPEDARGSFWSSGTTYAIGDRAQISTYSGTKYPNAPSGPRDQHYYEFQTYISKTAGNLNNPPASSPANWDVATDGGFFISQVAIDANGNALASPAPVRMSAMYAGVFPQESYVVSSSGITESGINICLVAHGFFPSLNGATLPQPYVNGGGMYEEYIDVRLVVVDAAAAATAAPVGVKAKCASGSVTLSWYDIVPGHSYRIKRGTSAGSINTTLADVSNVSQYIDTTATPGSVYYYSVTTLNGGVEAGLRAVSTYVGSYDQLTNQHMTRVLAAGADPSTIDEVRIKNFIAMLSAQDLLQHLMLGRFAWMGVAQTAVVSRCFDLGTSRLPRMGDLTLYDTGSSASTTTYSATAVNSVAPGLINPNTTSRGMYGNYGRGQGVMARAQLIQRKNKLTVISSYLKNGTGVFTPIAMNEFDNGMVLSEGTGAQGAVTFKLASTSPSVKVTATAPALSASDNPHIVGGIWDGTNLSCWAEAVSGTPVSGSGFDPTSISVYKQAQSNAITYPLMMGSASSKWSGTSYTPVGSYTWSDAHARGTMHADLIFDIDLTLSQMQAVTAWIRADAT